jgi:hypothetical protein
LLTGPDGRQNRRANKLSNFLEPPGFFLLLKLVVYAIASARGTMVMPEEWIPDATEDNTRWRPEHAHVNSFEAKARLSKILPPIDSQTSFRYHLKQ